MIATDSQPIVRRATSRDLERLGTLLVEEHHQFDARRFLAPRKGFRRTMVEMTCELDDGPK